MNPDGTFVDEDGAAEEYHVTDVSENDRKRLHYLKKQQRKKDHGLSLIHISEPTRPLYISYAVFCLKKKKFILFLSMTD